MESTRPTPTSHRRRVAALTTLAVVVGVGISVVLSGAPRVGSWRSTEGRAAYLAAYTEAMRALPRPDVVRDVPTSYGTVRAYRWASTADAPAGAAAPTPAPGATGAPATDPAALTIHRAAAVPVLLLPGVRSGTPMWGEQVSELRRHRDVYAVDAVGDAGLSTQAVPLTAPEHQAAWIEEVLTALSLREVHVVGHSFGGALAATYARLHPERVASLVLLEPAFTFAYPPPAVFAWATLAILPGVPASWRDHALARIGGVDVADVRADDPLGRMIAVAAEQYDGHAPTPTPLDDTALRELGMPVYVALAERDSLAGGRRAADRAGAVPRAVVETWPNTTHSLPMQAGLALTERLDAWWGDLER